MSLIEQLSLGTLLTSLAIGSYIAYEKAVDYTTSEKAVDYTTSEIRNDIQLQKSANELDKDDFTKRDISVMSKSSLKNEPLKITEENIDIFQSYNPKLLNALLNSKELQENKVSYSYYKNYQDQEWLSIENDNLNQKKYNFSFSKGDANDKRWISYSNSILLNNIFGELDNKFVDYKKSISRMFKNCGHINIKSLYSNKKQVEFNFVQKYNIDIYCGNISLKKENADFKEIEDFINSFKE